MSMQTLKILKICIKILILLNFEDLKKFVDLNLNLNLSDEPFLYISNVNSIVFVWRCLNKTFQNQLVNITNKLRPNSFLNYRSVTLLLKIICSVSSTSLPGIVGVNKVKD